MPGHISGKSAICAFLGGLFSGREFFCIECVLLVLKHYAPSEDTVDRREIPWMEQVVCKECSRANLGTEIPLPKIPLPKKPLPKISLNFCLKNLVLRPASTREEEPANKSKDCVDWFVCLLGE